MKSEDKHAKNDKPRAERLMIALFGAVLSVTFCWQLLGLMKLDWSDSQQDLENAIELQTLAAEYGKTNVQQAKQALGLRADGIIVQAGVSYLVEDLQHLSGRSEYSQKTNSPYRVILDFRDQLAQRNVELIVMIVDGKGYGANEGTSRLVDALSADGLRLIHVTGEPVDQYLKHDSHWRPELMEKYVRKLGELIVEMMPNSELDQSSLLERKEIVRNRGDLVRDGFTNQSTESVEVRSVVSENKTNRDGPILILGDSYANIFSEPEMGWGQSAGLGARLSFYLKSWCTTIAINGNGADASRKVLARNPSVLEGKKIVVWQFAARELDLGEWEEIAIPSHEHQKSSPVLARGIEEFTIIGLPKWNLDSLYPTSLTEVLLSRKSDGTEVLARLLLKKDRELTKASELRVGVTVRLKLSDISKQKNYQRAEVFTLDRYDLELFWAEQK